MSQSTSKQRYVDDLNDYARLAERTWWLYLVFGIVAVLFGMLLITLHKLETTNYAAFLGAFLIIIGGFLLLQALRRGYIRWLRFAFGVVAICFGIVALAWPGLTLYQLALIFGWSLVVWGTIDIVSAFNITEQTGWWFYLIRGVAAIVIGIWALGHPTQSLQLMSVLLGIAAVIYGIVEILQAFQTKDFPKNWEAQKAEMGLDSPSDSTGSDT